MKLIHGNSPSPEADDAIVQRALAAHYAAPTDPSYWERLEAQILSRVGADSAREWWSWFPGWVRYGVVAAAAAALMAVAASWQTRVAQERLAYRELLETPTEIPLLSERALPPDRDRSQTLRYLLTH